MEQNLFPSEPSLKDVLDLLKKDIFLSLNCHHVCTIQSFNSVNQTAKATINYKKSYFEPNSVTGTYSQVLADYPLLLDCPVIILGGGGGTLTFPIESGDEALVLFNDRDIDGWFAGSSNSAVPTPRAHSFSDGIILVGVRSLSNSIPSYDAERALLKKGDALVGVGKNDSLVKIANAQYTLKGLLQDLNSKLQSLTSQLQSLVTQTAAITVTGVTAGAAVSGPPANAAVITQIGVQIGTIGTEIGTISTQIGALLE
jgi:hypothetical protein